MALPKALLCTLPSQNGMNPLPQEDALRAAGFATATLAWSDLEDKTGRNWMEIPAILDDPSVHALVLAGTAVECGKEILARVSLWSLALTREKPLSVAFVLCGDDTALALPPLLGTATVFGPGAPFAARLMAARFKSAESPSFPFRLKAHMDPLIGLWLEVGPEKGAWEGFMAGLLEDDCLAVGVGKAGTLPNRCTLEHPMLGIRGDWQGAAFCAAAARNTLTGNDSCYIKANGVPHGLLLGNYPGEEAENPVEEAAVIRFC